MKGARFRSLAALIATVLLGCGRVASSSASACPPAYAPDPGRTTRIRGMLAADPEAAPLARDDRALLCFARGGPGVVSGDTLLLDGDQDDARLAARTAHLLAHRAAGSTLTSGDPNRPDERDANALERRVLARAR